MAGLQLRVFAGLPSSVLPLAEGVQVVGSAVRHGIVLRHPLVSPEHFLIEVRGSTCRVAPVSGAIVSVNGVPLTARRTLLPGEVIHAGPVGLLLEPSQSHLPLHHLIAAGMIAEEASIKPEITLIGSASECDLILPSAAISARHARITRSTGGLTVTLLSHAPDNLLNGRPFDERPLVAGDRLSLGPFRLQFNGRSLHVARESKGSKVVADQVTVTRGSTRLLDRISLDIEPGELVAILGPTGAGKSTLLGVLGGKFAPSAGRSTIDGTDATLKVKAGATNLGWVPQEDIVHGDLRVLQALDFATELRMPKGARRSDISHRVMSVAGQLNLTKDLETRVRRLSGGERKKVNVGAELTGSPAIMFLDEPTSGLDPAAETHMVGTLRALADSGCTVIYSTHRMDSLYLADRIFVLSDGMLVFEGPVDDACQFFGVRKPGEIFSRLPQRAASEWRSTHQALHPNNRPDPSIRLPSSPDTRRLRRCLQTPVLLKRQWALFASDWRNALLLFGQPILIGFLLAWAVQGTLNDSALKLFFCGMAVLWLGCSNGAQELVGERRIYLRERMAGLHQRAYISSKWLFVAAMTLAQFSVLYLVTRFVGAGMGGSWEWQVLGLAAVALVGSALGLAISSCVQTATQAVLLVPTVIIPMIVLSGYTVPASDMSITVRATAWATPTFQLQRILDTSMLWNRSVDAGLMQSNFQAIENLREVANVATGSVFSDAEPGRIAFLVFLGWIVICLITTSLGLRSAEKKE